MVLLRAMPLFGVIWLLYNGILLVGGVATLEAQLFSTTLISGAQWVVRVADLLLALGLLALYLELFKATGTGLSSVINHSLSTLVFIAFVVQFIIVPEAGNSTFMLLTLMALMDVITGFTVTIVAARRDLAVGEGFQR